MSQQQALKTLCEITATQCKSPQDVWLYEGGSQSNVSGLITLISGLLGTSARHVLKALYFTFPMIPSIAQRLYFLLSYNAFY